MDITLPMKKLIAYIAVIPLALSIMSGCENSSNLVSNNSSKPAASQTQIDPKITYVQHLNDLQIRNDLKVISSYGVAVSQLDESNDNDVQALKNVDKDGIPKYQSILNDLKKMSVPNEYKPFHKLLIDSISNFISAMQEMNNHLNTQGDTTHLQKSTSYYIVSTESIKELVKKLPFGQLN